MIEWISNDTGFSYEWITSSTCDRSIKFIDITYVEGV